MKRYFLILLLGVCCFFKGFSQKEKVLLTINNKPVFVDEFKRVYEKNLDLLEDKESKNIDNYLDLFINYKLKVNEAYQIKLDTLSNYIKELELYKKQLLAPYLQDDDFVNKLVKDAYYRTKNEVRVSHILVKIPRNILPQDTVDLYQKINNARERILKGERFETVAKEVSEDPSVSINGGDLGYFNAFKMVYPFEDASYNTVVGSVSKPFKTRFGYHIIKVFDKRLSKGEFDAAHILLKNSKDAKKKIDSLHQLLVNEKASFGELAELHSEDKGSAKKGGKLPKFGTGAMVAPFENAVLALQNEGEISKPFQTRFGWHIVKLLKNYPIASFKELESDLMRKIRSSSRMKLSETAMLNKLKKEYKIKVDKNALKELKNAKTEDFSKVLLTINEKQIKQQDFINFKKNRKKRFLNSSFEEFENQEVLNYFKDELVNTNQEFKNVYLEYKEGLLLFELMQRKIWDKSSKDTLGLKAFYTKNKTEKYQDKNLEEIKGLVINDYQKEIEENWVATLRKRNKIVVKKGVLKKLKKQYNQ